tara:strand:+ start:7116 stop:7238 length:123 start_codon:yes stop_codon:yes gene_type:complete
VDLNKIQEFFEMFDTSDTFDIRKKQLKMKVKLMLIRKKIS